MAESGPSIEEQFADDPWPIVGFLTTEHTTLTSQRATLTAETNGRVASYLTTLSAALVALGFVGGGGDGFGADFFRFGVVAFATVAAVGTLTFLRCLQASVEDLLLAARSEQVREVYFTLVPGLANHLQPPPSRGLDAARRAGGMTGAAGWQLGLTLAGLVSVLNSLVTGLAVAFALRLAELASVAIWVTGAVVCVSLIGGHVVVQSVAFARGDRARVAGR